MRNLFMSLLLINALAWAYQSWVLEPDKPVAARHIDQGYPRLQLLARQGAGSAVPAEPALDNAAEAAGENAVKCLKIGPIIGENDAISIAGNLGGRGIEVRRSAEQGQVWVGHWVQVAGLPSRQVAELARDRLVDAGLNDSYIVTGGSELKISLGVFKSTRSADAIVARARELGFETRIEERYQPGVQYWLAVRLAGGLELLAGDLRSDTGQILRTEVLPCSNPDA